MFKRQKVLIRLKQKRALDEWNCISDEIVHELHRRDAYLSHTHLCARCTEPLEDPERSYRCIDCSPDDYYCKSCIVKEHLLEPFHHAEASALY